MGAGLQRRPQPPRGPPPGDRPHVPSRLSPPGSARAASGGRLGLCSGGGGAGAGPGGRTRHGSGRHRREEGVPPAQPAQARTTHCGPSVRLPQLGGAGVLGAPTKPRADTASPSPLPRPAGSPCGTHPRVLRTPQDRGTRETQSGRAKGRASLMPASHGSHATRLVEGEAHGETGRPLKPAARGATAGACRVLLKSHGQQSGREV